MSIKEYIEAIKKSCPELYTDKKGEIRCNGYVVLEIEEDNIFWCWNERFLPREPKGYANKRVGIQTYFPEPQDFVKFLYKVLKEIENE